MQHEKPSAARFWAVVPAAGVGARMGGGVPKQYLPLLGKPIIAHTLARIGRHPRISGVVVAVAAHDQRWPEVAASLAFDPVVAPGGRERRDSVLAGLEALRGRARDSDWALVHDAVRPCLRARDMDRLMDALVDDEVGGLLAMPVRDTMKRADADGRVAETISRESLWHAQTPQMFRIGALRDALRQSVAAGTDVTDEARAMELAGARPRLVPGHEENIKITRPEDLRLAAMYLSGREEDA